MSRITTFWWKKHPHTLISFFTKNCTCQWSLSNSIWQKAIHMMVSQKNRCNKFCRNLRNWICSGNSAITHITRTHSILCHRKKSWWGCFVHLLWMLISKLSKLVKSSDANTLSCTSMVVALSLVTPVCIKTIQDSGQMLSILLYSLLIIEKRQPILTQMPSMIAIKLMCGLQLKLRNVWASISSNLSSLGILQAVIFQFP
jgi:hypothetical protein